MARRYELGGSTASQIAASIEAGVRTGGLAPGADLPTVRSLATELGVSPGTVAAAYAGLRTAGVVVTDGRRGTKVAARPPIAAPAIPDVAPGLRDLASGNPDPLLLPDLGPWLRPTDRRYGDRPVVDALAAAGRRWLADDGIAADAVTVVNGALDGIERALVANRSRVVAVEVPGYAAVHDLVAALGLARLAVEVDDEGPTASGLADALTAGADAVVLTTRAQNPTGAALSEGRARQLRRVLRGHPEVLVLEDDHAGPVAGPAAATTTTGRSRWAVCRSVAKSLGPDLRLAVLAGDDVTVTRVEGRLALGPGWVSGILQHAAAGLLSDRGTRRLLERATATYATRREALIDALAAVGVDAHGTSGLNVWIPVPDEADALAALRSAGFAARPGSRFTLPGGPPAPAIRITTATLDPVDAGAVAAALTPRQAARRFG